MPKISDTPVRKTQFETYFTVWNRFAARLAESPDRHVISLAESWETSKANYSKWLNDPNSKITHSRIGAAMKHGLREMPLVLSDCPAEIREPLLSALVEILREEAPEFYQEDEIKLQKILKRGRVRNENEWRLIRYKVDTIERQKESSDELAILYELLDSFERVDKTLSCSKG